jgi:hypothetical protein
MDIKETIERFREKEVERLKNEISRVICLEPVMLRHVPWQKRIGSIGDCGHPLEGDVHAECECPNCGVKVHHFMPEYECYASMHTCSLCGNKYLIAWEPPQEG